MFNESLLQSAADAVYQYKHDLEHPSQVVHHHHHRQRQRPHILAILDDQQRDSVVSLGLERFIKVLYAKFHMGSCLRRPLEYASTDAPIWEIWKHVYVFDSGHFVLICSKLDFQIHEQKMFDWFLCRTFADEIVDSALNIAYHRDAIHIKKDDSIILAKKRLPQRFKICTASFITQTLAMANIDECQWLYDCCHLSLLHNKGMWLSCCLRIRKASSSHCPISSEHHRGVLLID